MSVITSPALEVTRPENKCNKPLKCTIWMQSNIEVALCGKQDGAHWLGACLSISSS